MRGNNFQQHSFSASQIQLIYMKDDVKIFLSYVTFYMYILFVNRCRYILVNVYMSIFSCVFLYYGYGIIIYVFYSVQYAIIVFLVLIAEIAGVVLAALMKKDVSTHGFLYA